MSPTQPRSPTTSAAPAKRSRKRSEVEEAIQAFGTFRPTSLDRPIRPDGATVVELLGDEDRAFSTTEVRLALAPLMSDLTPRQRRILYLRYFEEKSQSEIGAELGVTQMQVSRLLQRILAKLRERADHPFSLAG